jgi:replicative DNA helicase
MNELLTTARHYLSLGLSIVPTGKDKRCSTEKWDPFPEDPLTFSELLELTEGKTIRPDYTWEKNGQVRKGIKMFGELKGIGIIGGTQSATGLVPLEIIDVDSKNDLTGTLWHDLTAQIKFLLGEELYSSFPIVKTPSGGYHIYYRASNTEKSSKLAERPATLEELEKDPRAKTICLLETRGLRGYVVAPPSPGYEFIQGSAEMIPVINPDQRNELRELCRSFSTVETQEQPARKKKTPATGPALPGTSPVEDFQNRVDFLEILQEYGFEIGATVKNMTYIRRKGSKASSSGNYRHDLRLLKFFSSSVDGFEPGQAYPIYEAYTILSQGSTSKESCNASFKELLEKGYGSLEWREAKDQEYKAKKARADEPPHPADVYDQPGKPQQAEHRGQEQEPVLPPGKGQLYIHELTDHQQTPKALQHIQAKLKSGYRVLVQMPGYPEPVAWYKYELLLIYEKYEPILNQSGTLTDSQAEELRTEILNLGQRIPDPMDRDLYRTMVLTGYMGEIGVTPESLDITLSRLQADKDTENQRQALELLLGKAGNLQQEGKTKEALEALTKEADRIKVIGAQNLLPPSVPFAGLLEQIATQSPSYSTGYPSLDRFVSFSTGTLNLIAGRPGHGKTTLMFNLLLEMAEIYKEETFYFFTYEEPTKNLFIKLLNRLTNENLEPFFREEKEIPKATNYELLKHYISRHEDHISEIEKGKDKLRKLWDSGRIRIVDQNYPVEELATVIRYLTDQGNMGPVFIDYAQRITTTRQTQDKRTEVAHVSNQLLQIAKENDLPLIVGAQFHRGAKGGGTQDNLKEAGNLEEDANTALSVYCADREAEETKAVPGAGPKRDADLEVTALKNREGDPTGKALLSWDRWTSCISDKTTARTTKNPSPAISPEDASPF